MARARLLLAVLLALALGASGGIGLLVLSSPAAAAPVRAGAPARTVCSLPAPRTAAGYQAMFDGKHDDSWAGGDQAASVALPGGKVLWMFGDSLRGRRIVHNAMLVQTGGCLAALPAEREVVPTRADGQWYWPQSAVVVGDRLVVLCARVRRTGPGPFGFRTTGVDAAVFTLAGGMPRLLEMRPTPSSQSPESTDQYGKAVLSDGGWLYVYGSRQVPGAFGRVVAVARARAGALLRPGSWQYWTGSGWSAHGQPAAAVAAGWSTAFSVWRDPDGTVRSLTKLDDVFGRAVVTGAASSPTAPFRQRTVLDAPSAQQPGELRYNALAHPELRLQGGLLLVTVCRNNTDLHKVWADPDLYKPQFAAVPWTGVSYPAGRTPPPRS
jgi:hypothetical protein